MLLKTENLSKAYESRKKGEPVLLGGKGSVSGDSGRENDRASRSERQWKIHGGSDDRRPGKAHLRKNFFQR